MKEHLATAVARVGEWFLDYMHTQGLTIITNEEYERLAENGLWTCGLPTCQPRDPDDTEPCLVCGQLDGFGGESDD